MHQHVAAVTVAPVAGRHLRSPHARTRVDWWFVRYGELPGGHDGEGPGLIVIIMIIIDRGARGRGGQEAVAAGTAAVTMAAAVTVAATEAAVYSQYCVSMYQFLCKLYVESILFTSRDRGTHGSGGPEAVAAGTATVALAAVALAAAVTVAAAVTAV